MECHVPIKSIKKNSFFLEAQRQALKSTIRHRHGCVIVYADKEIISRGYNYVIQANDDHFISIHAEVSAIKKLCRKYRTKDFLSKCVLYVVRIGPDSRDNHFKISIPCENCTRFIHSAGILKVVFSLTTDTFGTLLF